MQRIAITQRVVENSSYPERRDALSQNWVRLVMGLYPDAALIPVPNSLDSPAAWLDSVDPEALILSNGDDWGVVPERDHTETELYHKMLKLRRPILGACRGLQAINVIEGGGITRDIWETFGENHVAEEHDIRIIDNSLKTLLGRATIRVNSYHNQGVAPAELAKSLKAFALGPGEIVEGLYHSAGAVLAIQWHPERDNPSADLDTVLIRKFFESGAFWQ